MGRRALWWAALTSIACSESDGSSLDDVCYQVLSRDAQGNLRLPRTTFTTVHRAWGVTLATMHLDATEVQGDERIGGDASHNPRALPAA